MKWVPAKGQLQGHTSLQFPQQKQKMKFFLLFFLRWLWLWSFSRWVLKIELSQHSRIWNCCCYSRLKPSRENGLAELLPFSAETKNIIYLLNTYSFSSENKKKYKDRGRFETQTMLQNQRHALARTNLKGYYGHS